MSFVSNDFCLFVLCGGLATRLRTIEPHKPKVLVHVKNIPMIEYVLTWAELQGHKELVLLLGHKGHIVTEYLSCHQRPGLTIRYSFDGVAPIGTWGAIRNAWNELGKNRDVMVVFGDSILSLCSETAIKAFQSRNLPFMMTGCPIDISDEPGNMEVGQQMVLKYPSSASDSSHVDYGVTVVAASHVQASGDRELRDVLRVAVERREVGFQEVNSRYVEVGTPDALRRANAIDFAGELSWARSVAGYE
jgi:NDP-sugar pyrophosphorylase family protein